MPATLTYLLSLTRRQKRILLMICDSLLILAAFGLALILRGVDPRVLAQPEVVALMVVPVPLLLVLFWRFGLYLIVLRYITGRSMLGVMAGTGASTVWMGGMILFLERPVPLAIAPLHGLLVLMVVGGLRFGMRSVLRLSGLHRRKPVIIYGASETGQQLVAALHQGLEYRPVAFVDDDPGLHGTTINGVSVHPASDLRALARQWDIREVLIAMPRTSRARRRLIVSQMEKLGVAVKIIASMNDVVAGHAHVSDLRPVMPEDMLGRDPVPPNPDLMRRTIAGKVVMVTGAGGSIGSELCRQIVLQKPAALVLLDVSEYALYAISTELRDTLGANGPRLIPVLGSVQKQDAIRALLRRFKVQTVYHAAAYKHVSLVEDNVIEGLYNNIFGTRVVAEAAAAAGVETFILVSTDKTVRPSNVMGASKRVAELICQALDQSSRTAFCMVRFGNVLGSSGSVIPRFREQIERGGPVTVTHRKVTRYFMTLSEAAQLVIQAGAMAKGGDVFLLDMGQPVRILDLAKSMIRLHGLTPFVVDEAGNPEGEAGDIPIHITGLAKGEKLFEELLIGSSPGGTEHPRIMVASEAALGPAEVSVLLDALWAACQAFDLALALRILREAPLQYRPGEGSLEDLRWSSAKEPSSQSPALRLIDGATQGRRPHR